MIDQRYTLFTRIPIKETCDGRMFCDPLWEKDLQLHLDYLKRFSICCPVEPTSDTRGLTEITETPFLKIFRLKPDHGLGSILKNLLPNFLSAWNACRSSDIVHSDGAGWAFPLSFYILPISRILSFKWVIVIESSFWMIEAGEKRTLRNIIEHHLHRVLLTQCVRRADARIFTQSFYRDFFLKGRRDRTLINPATWVDEDVITTHDELEARHLRRADAAIRIILPTRLEEEKGVLVALKAIEILAGTDKRIEFTLMGTGRLESRCRAFIDRYKGNVRVRLEEPVPYGRPFFHKISEYDFVLAPTLKQEQPRIVFDAFSQGVPIIGSDTSGIRDITGPENALLFARGDAESLAQCIMSAQCTRPASLEMGLAGLSYAKGKTHSQMHRVREDFLVDTLSKRRTTSVQAS